MGETDFMLERSHEVVTAMRDYWHPCIKARDKL
jgi:hypothetical protein